jgi:hypothetical protein
MENAGEQCVLIYDYSRYMDVRSLEVPFSQKNRVKRRKLNSEFASKK